MSKGWEVCVRTVSEDGFGSTASWGGPGDQKVMDVPCPSVPCSRTHDQPEPVPGYARSPIPDRRRPVRAGGICPVEALEV